MKYVYAIGYEIVNGTAHVILSNKTKTEIPQSVLNETVDLYPSYGHWDMLDDNKHPFFLDWRIPEDIIKTLEKGRKNIKVLKEDKYKDSVKSKIKYIEKTAAEEKEYNKPKNVLKRKLEEEQKNSKESLEVGLLLGFTFGGFLLMILLMISGKA